MRDAELLTRWYAFQYYAPDYTGDLKSFLDRACKTLNDEWPHAEQGVKAALAEFEAAVATSFAIFGENAFRKWTPAGYERLFNRAIFDIMTFYFALPALRAAAEAEAPAVEQAFKNFCEQDQEFLASIERTTKSMGATSFRLSAWAEELSRITGLAILSPLPRKA